MAYGSASGVAALCKHLTTQGDGAFNNDTTPTRRQVLAFLDDGSALMDAEMSQNGFSTPVTASLVTAVLDPIAEFYAAAMAESVETVRRSDWQGTSESSKPTHWMELHRGAMDRIMMERGKALSILGATRGTSLAYGLHAGGLSEDEKDTWEDDSDFIEPRFKIGMMDNKTVNW
ncbi:MAG: hypothetical protein GWN58_67085 [Anaerolineae bacterium]|nr:hypothetical protein [Anaerolineae bacterium]